MRKLHTKFECKAHVVSGAFAVHLEPSSDLYISSTSPLVPQATTKLTVKYHPRAIRESVFDHACIVWKSTVVVVVDQLFTL